MKQSQQLRQLIYYEANKQFDFQPDVLYEAIKDKPIEGTTVKEYLQQHFLSVAPGSNFENAIYSLHYVQFAVPVHLDKWNPTSPIPVTFLPAQWNEATLENLETYNPDGTTTFLSAKNEPSFPVLVVSEAERIDKKGNLRVDPNGIVLTPESRIHYSKALALAEKRHTLKSTVKVDPLIVVLPDDSFAQMKASIQNENLIRQQQEKQLLLKLENSAKRHLKNAMNVNVKKITLSGYTDVMPRVLHLQWNNPTNLTLRFYIYATGYFNVNGQKVFKEKQLIKYSDNLQEPIVFPYPYEAYVLWVEGRYYQNSLQAASNYLILHTSDRKNPSKEYVSKVYFSSSKIKEIEGWYASNIELKYVYSIATSSSTGIIIPVNTEYSVTVNGAGWGPWWHPEDTERNVEFPILEWLRNYFNINKTVDNGVLSIAWREYDGGSNNQKVTMNVNAVAKVSYSDSTQLETISYITNLSVEVDNNDEPLGSYMVTWWTPNNCRMLGGDCVIWHSFE
ncbi:MAG: hypothetical protein WHT29_07010 [Bacteroidales bacterium]